MYTLPDQLVGWVKSVSDNKYEEILSVSASLINKKDYVGVSLQEVANKVGLHKSTLFHYIRSKEDLLVQIFDKSPGEVSENLEKITSDASLKPEEKLKNAIHNHISLLVKNFDYANIFLNQVTRLPKKNQATFLKQRKKYEKNFEKIVREMKTKGYFKKLDGKIVTFALLGMLNWLPKWYKRRGPLTVKDLSNVFYKLIVEK